MRKFFLTAFLGLSVMLCSVPVSAASFTYYTDFTSFNAALAGAPLLTQDFEGYSDGDNLDGVEFLPGISVTSNKLAVEAWSTDDISLFAYICTPGCFGNAYYDINFGSGYNAVSFYIEDWNPTPPANGPAVVETSFADSDSASTNWYQTGASENDPVFFGIISDSNISSIRWNQSSEIDGTGNEEVTLDNFAVASTSVPEPSTLLLLGSGLVGLVGMRKRLKS